MTGLNTSALVMGLTHMSRFTTTTVLGGNKGWLWLRSLGINQWRRTRRWCRSCRPNSSDLPTHIGGKQQMALAKKGIKKKKLRRKISTRAIAHSYLYR